MKSQNSESRIQRVERGFTLIELLVAVTIISLLTVIGVVNYRQTVKKGRDAKRQADLEQIRSALEIYRSNSGTNEYPEDVDDLVTDGYLNSMPTDPKSYDYYYNPAADYKSYELCAHVELDSSANTTGGCSGGDCGSGADCNYEMTSP